MTTKQQCLRKIMMNNKSAWTHQVLPAMCTKESCDSPPPPSPSPFRVGMDGWLNDLKFGILFNCIPAVSGRWMGNNKRLCTVKTNRFMYLCLPKEIVNDSSSVLLLGKKDD